VTVPAIWVAAPRFHHGRKGYVVAREVEDVSIVNKHRLALAAVFDAVRAAAPKPAPGPLLQLSESGAVTTNKGQVIREAKPQTK